MKSILVLGLVLAAQAALANPDQKLLATDRILFNSTITFANSSKFSAQLVTVKGKTLVTDRFGDKREVRCSLTRTIDANAKVYIRQGRELAIIGRGNEGFYSVKLEGDVILHCEEWVFDDPNDPQQVPWAQNTEIDLRELQASLPVKVIRATAPPPKDEDL